MGSLYELVCMAAIFWAYHRRCHLCPVLLCLLLSSLYSWSAWICVRVREEWGSWERHSSSLLPWPRALMLGPCVTSAAAEGPETWFQRCLKCYPVIHTPCFSSHLLTSLMFSSKSCGTCWLLHMVVSVQIKLYLVLEQLGLAIILFSSGRCLLQCSPGSTCYEVLFMPLQSLWRTSIRALMLLRGAVMAIARELRAALGKVWPRRSAVAMETHSP